MRVSYPIQMNHYNINECSLQLTSALAVRGITNVTLSWSQTPKEEVIQRQFEIGESVPTSSHPE